jgi:hypothetical protein
LFALLALTGSVGLAQATKVLVETADDGTGVPLGDTTLAAGQTITVYAISRDDFDNFIENVQADPGGWDLINVAGGVVAGDLNPSGNRRSAVFTARKVGSAQINVTSSGLVSIPSGVQTVIPGPAVRVAVETLANGTGVVVPTQNLVSGSSLAAFSITRDAFDNFVANEPAAWDLQNITGGIVPGDLTASGDGKGAQLFAELVGTAGIRAVVGGLTDGLSGTITVVPGPATQVAFAQQPTDDIAGNPIDPPVTVHILDGAGNLRTTSTRNVTLALGANPGGGTLSGTLTVSAVGGIATFSTLSIDKVGAGYTLVASSPNPTPLTQATSVPFNITAGSASQLAFVQQPGTVASNAPITPAITVQLLDAGGNPVTGPQRNITLALGANPGGGTLGGTVSVATVNGLATFSNISIDKAGAGYTLVASSASPNPPLTQATSSAFTVTPGPASQLAFVQQPGTTASGASISPPVTVQLLDAAGNAVTGPQRNVIIALGANPGGGTLSGPTSVATVNGLATFGALSIDKVGNGYTLVATSPSPNPPLAQATSAGFNITAAAAAQLVFVQQPANGTSGLPLSPAISVQLLDAAGNAVTGPERSITIALGNNPGGGALSGTATVTTVNGVATFSTLSVDKVGVGYTLVASSASPAPPLTQATSAGFTIGPGVATQLAIVQQPGTATSGVALAPAVTVQLRDAAGNNVTSPERSVTMAIGANPSGGALTGTPTVTTVNGLATFSNLVLDKAGAGYTLVASSPAPGPALTTATTSAFTVAAGAATQLVFVQQPSATASGAPIAPAITVQLRDAAGNNVTSPERSVSIALGANPGAGTLAGTLNVTTVNGLATFGAVTIDKAGNGYTIVASSPVPGPALAQATSSAFNITPGAATQLVFVQQPNNAVSGVAINPAVTVQLLDAAGNPVTSPQRNVTVSLGANPGGGTLGGTLTVATVNGVATFSTLSVDKAAVGYTLVASSPLPGPALTTVTSAPFDISAGPAARLAFVQQPSNIVSGAAISPAVTVQLRDAAGNPVTSPERNITLTLGANPGGGTLSGTLTVLTSGGIATFSTLTVDKAGAGYTLAASLPPLTGATSAPFNVAAGTASKVRVETAADGTGAVVPSQTLPSGSTLTVYAISRDAADNFISNVAASSWVLDNRTGGVVPGDLVAAGDSRSAVLTGRITGTAQIRATSGALTQVPSGIVTVIAGAAAKVRVETAADGTGAVVPPQTLTSGSSLTMYSVSRDASDNFVANVVATWDLQNITGGVVAGDLIPAGDGRSAVFTGNVSGTARVRATSGSLTRVLSGIITVGASVATKIQVETEPDGTGTIVPDQSLASGAVLTVYAVSRDGFNNFVANIPGVWTLQNVTGGVVAGDLVPSADSRSATLTGKLVGSARIRATSGSLTPSNSGVVTVVAGPATQIRVETASNGTGAVVPAQSLASGAALTAYAVTRDAAGNFVSNSAATWTLQGVTGGVVQADLDPAADNRSAVFTAGAIGSASIQAASGVLTAVPSGTVTVGVGAPSKVRVETAANGSGVVVPAATLPADSAITVFAISRDASDNFVENVSAIWALQNKTGGVVDADLTPAGDGKSAVFKGRGIGTARIVAGSGSLTLVPSGTITVVAGPARRLLITGPAVMTAGVPDSLTIRALDGGGNTATGYTGNKNLVFSGADPSPSPSEPAEVVDRNGNRIDFGGVTVIRFTNGVATVTGSNNGVLYLYKVQTANISVTDALLLIGSGGSGDLVVRVEPGLSDRFQLALATPQTSGVVFRGSNTLTVLDAFGNVVTRYNASNNNVTIATDTSLAGTVSGLGVTGGNTLDRPNDFVDGVADLTAIGMMYTGVSGTGRFTATSSSGKTGQSGIVRVDPGSATRLVVTGPVSAGAGDAQTVTITAKDPAGNTDAGYTGQKALTFVGASASPDPVLPPTATDDTGAPIVFGQPVNLTFTAGVATTTMTLYRVETAVIGVDDGAIAAAGADRLTVNVTRAAFARFILVLQTPQANAVPFTGTNAIAATDGYGNLIIDFNAEADNVAWATTLGGVVSGLGSLGNNVMNRSTDFVNGVADLTGKLTYTGQAGTGSFTASSVTGRTGSIDGILVTNPAPTFATLAPTIGNRTSVLSLDVTGTEFIQDVTALSLGDSVTVDSVIVESPTRLRAVVTIARGAVLGPRDVTVFNPGPGGGIATISGVFTITDVPTLSGVTPPNAVRGQTLNLTFRGTNFQSGVSTLGLVGSNILVNSQTVVSDRELAANVTVTLDAADGVRLFTVTNGGQYGGTSNPAAFFVGLNPAPTVDLVSPRDVKRLQTVQVVVSGGEFYNGLTSVDPGQGIHVLSMTVDTVSRLQATLMVSDTALTGRRQFAVINRGPGGGTAVLDDGLIVTNPRPQLTNLVPQSGSRLQTEDVTITGANFIAGVTSMDFGPDVAILNLTVSDPTTMIASILIASTAAIGPRSVIVTNTQPGGGPDTLENAFTINNPGALLASLSVDSVLIGAPDLSLQVTGDAFVAESIVRLDSLDLPTTFVSTTALGAVIPAGALDTAKVFDIIVVNPGAGQSNTLPFAVLNPAPVLASVAPDTANRLDTVQAVLTGSGIVPGFTTVVVSPADDITVSDVAWPDTSHVTATIAVSAGAAIGARSISLSTVSPGGGSSEFLAFRVAGNPAPTLAAVEPAVCARLDTVSVRLIGTDFIPGVTTASFGPGITVDSLTVEGTDRLRAILRVSSTAPSGSRLVTVTNSGPGGGTSNGRTFQVNNPIPEFHTIAPSNGEQGQTFNVEINGRRFIQGVTSVNMGTGILLNSGSVTNDTTIIASITISPTAGTGARDISVSNAPPGGGVSILVNGFVVGANPVPDLVSVQPDSGGRSTTMDVTLTGTNFLGGITSVDFGGGITVQNVDVDSSARLTARIAISPDAAIGPRTVTVINQPPGGGRDSIAAGFNVVNPRPVLTSIAPSSGIVTQTIDVALTGSGFLPGVSTIAFGDTAVRVNSLVVDSTSGLRASITIGPGAVLGQTPVTVVNAAPGGGSSAARVFTIVVAPPAVPVLTSPPDGATDLATVMTLSWQASSRAVTYRLEVSTSPSFSSKVVDQSGVTATSMQVGPLANNTTHYWRVTATNPGGDSGPSATWSFTPSYPSVFPLSQTIDFPNLSTTGEYRTEDYKIVGIPGALGEPVTNLLPGSHQTDWDMFWDNGATTDFLVRYDGSDTFRYIQGRAFWLIKRGGWSINRTVPTPVVDTAGVTTVAVHPGWNLITNPFITPIPWTDIKSLNGPIDLEPIQGFDQFFTVAATMEPYEGYYFFNKDNRASIRIPYPGFKQFSKAAAPDSGSWWASLWLRAGRYVDGDTRFGVHPASAAGLDQRDFHKARGLGDAPGIFFYRPEWDERYPVFGGDIRPAGQGLLEWDFEVRSRGREEHAISLAEVEQVPGDLQIVLIDRVRGRHQDLRESLNYAFTPVTDVSKFSVVVGTTKDIQRAVEEALPREFALGENFPNPFNPSTTIPVSVPQAADVSVRIYSIVGEEVAVLHHGPLDAGRYWMTWDARNGGGRAVATGVYLVRMTSSSGFAATKKMLLMK